MGYKQIYFTSLFDESSFLLDEKREIHPHKKSKKAAKATRLSYNDILTHNFKLEKKSSLQELDLAIELKMYEDLGLDIQKSYKIVYVEKESQIDDMLLIEAFAIDKEKIKQAYQRAFKKTKYFDFIAAPFLAFETLYTNNHLPKANDLFLYMEEEEAFIVFCKEGHYISSKKIKTIAQLSEELHAKNIYITTEELKEILHTKGLVQENYEPSQYALLDFLQNAFDTILSTIKNLALHNRSIYNFTQLDNLYPLILGGTIPGFQEKMAQFLEESHLQHLASTPKASLSFLDILCANYVADQIAADDYRLNLALEPKKTPFLKSEVGKFTIASTLLLSLSLAYPLYQEYLLQNAKQEKVNLQERLDQIASIASKLQKKTKDTKKEIATLLRKEKEINQNLQRLHRITQTLLDLKSKDKKYTAMLLSVNRLLKKYRLTLDKVNQSGERSLDFELISKENRRDTIALFMHDLLEEGYSKVTSNEITHENDLYKSVVKVKR